MHAPLRSMPLLLALALVAPPASAQPGASWVESGKVDILVYAEGGGIRFGREAAAVLESDVIDEITIGDSGPPETRDVGSLAIEGIGTIEGGPRDLGDVFVLVGDLDINDSLVDGWIRVGPGSFTVDEGSGSLSVLLSEIDARVTVRTGTLGCSMSTMADVTMLDQGHATFSNCHIGFLAASSSSAETSITNSILDGASPSLGGTMGISSSTLDTTNPTVTNGDVTIGLGGPVVWTNAAQIRVRGASAPTSLLLNDSTVSTQTTYWSVGSGGLATSVTLQGATSWLSYGLLQVVGSPATIDVNSASRIDARDDLYIGAGSVVTVRSGVAEDSRIDVGGDLGVGNVDADTFSSGTLNIEDGAVVDVDGTLYIRPLATVNLNGGTLRVTQLVEDGTLNENGGTLIVPESGAAASATVALATLASRARRRPS